MIAAATPAFSTIVDDEHIWHRSRDGEALPGQPNPTFAHRTDWFQFCTLCEAVLYPQMWLVTA
jgi:hypothetical protein